MAEYIFFRNFARLSALSKTKSVHFSTFKDKHQINGISGQAEWLYTIQSSLNNWHIFYK